MSIHHIPFELCDIVKCNILEDTETPWNTLAFTDRNWRHWVNTHRFCKLLNDEYLYSQKVLLLPNILDPTLWNKHDCIFQHIEHLNLRLLSGQSSPDEMWILSPTKVENHTYDGLIISAIVQAVKILSRRSKQDGATLHISLSAPEEYIQCAAENPNEGITSRATFSDFNETLTASLFLICCHSRLSTLSISNILNIPPDFFESIDVTKLSLSNSIIAMPRVLTSLESISLPNVKTLIIQDQYTSIKAFLNSKRRPEMVLLKLTDITYDRQGVQCICGEFRL